MYSFANVYGFARSTAILYQLCVVRTRVLKKSTAKQKTRFCAVCVFRKQHEFKKSHFDIECPLLANGSYKIKIRVL